MKETRAQINKRPITFSKSKYTSGCQCPKIIWMGANMPEQFDASVMNEDILTTGNLVGDLAMGYFGAFVEVPFDHNDRNRFTKAIALTRDFLAAGERTICEATFATEASESSYGTLPPLYCMVDILRVRDDGSVDIIEVKSSTHVKDVHLEDLAFQAWVLQQNGFTVNSTSLMHINNKYERQGELDIHELFSLENCTEEVMGTILAELPQKLSEIATIANASEEPQIEIGAHCTSPYPCGYKNWCWHNMPSPNVFDINRINKEKASNLHAQGLDSFEDIAANEEVFSRLNERQQNQILAEINEAEPYINHLVISNFLDGLSYPLYFLDFETFQEAVPSFDGQRPFEQVTSQYSLHWIDEPGGELKYTEFLGEGGTDPRRALAEQLCKDIPSDACVLAWNMAFEQGRISEMAAMFPDLELHLMAIHDNIQDLIDPFRKGGYYDRAMGGSNSIKAVLPALFPDDPELDYHALVGVHNGGEAAAAFKNLPKHTPDEQARIREQLLKYCELDTLAMVRIWEKLCDL